jgi:SAM-dependent methyltransferase
MSVQFYENNAEDFFRRSVDAEMLREQARFAALLPAGARILDAGCGSGRDARWFREQGFEVTATEAAPTLAALASGHAGLPVQVLTFDQMVWRDAFEGIWTCASLLHVPRADLPGVVGRLRLALAPGGLWFMSFKYGRGERQAGDRRFTDLDEADAQALLADVGGLTLLSMEVTGDVRPDRLHERWLSLFCRRSA